MRLDFIPAQFISVTTASRRDLSQFLLGGVYIAPGTSTGKVRLWKINADFTNAGEISVTTDAGKDNTVALEILDNGDVLVTVSEALGAEGPGSSSQPNCQRLVSIFPPAAPVTAVDQAARNQANAATNMAHAAQADIDALTKRVELLENAQ